MPVNGWMGLAFELRREEDATEVLPLQRAAAIARQSERLRRASITGELQREALEAQLAVLRHALDIGDAGLARRVGRTLRAADFAGLDGFLAVLRDARSSAHELFEAVAALSLRVTPSPE
jgi:hypothetical protein